MRISISILWLRASGFWGFELFHLALGEMFMVGVCSWVWGEYNGWRIQSVDLAIDDQGSPCTASFPFLCLVLLLIAFGHWRKLGWYAGLSYVCFSAINIYLYSLFLTVNFKHRYRFPFVFFLGLHFGFLLFIGLAKSFCLKKLTLTNFLLHLSTLNYMYIPRLPVCLDPNSHSGKCAWDGNGDLETWLQSFLTNNNAEKALANRSASENHL